MTRRIHGHMIGMLASAVAFALLLALVTPLDRGRPAGRVHPPDAHSSIPHGSNGAPIPVDQTTGGGSARVAAASFNPLPHDASARVHGRDLGKPLGPPPRLTS